MQTLKQAHAVLDKIRTVFAKNEYEKETDPEFCLYDGFFGEKDKNAMSNVRNYEPGNSPLETPVFEDSRLVELFLRYKARNFPELLSDDEKQQWDEYRQSRLFEETHANALTIERVKLKIAQLKADGTQYEARLPVLDELLNYIDTLEHKYQSAKN